MDVPIYTYLIFERYFTVHNMHILLQILILLKTKFSLKSIFEEILVHGNEHYNKRGNYEIFRLFLKE